MSDIPPEILNYDILLRVPAINLFRFRFVCKAWRSIIDDFGLDHLLIRNDTGKLYLLRLSSIDCSKINTVVEMTNIKNLVSPGVPRIWDLPVPSSTGLILLNSLDKEKEWTLWNPLTGESIPLPPQTRAAGLSGWGVGYDSATDDVKVVKIFPDQGPEQMVSRTMIYSLKLNYWKSIPNFLKSTYIYGNGMFVNGAMHWIGHQHELSFIVSLDLSTEEERVFPRPSFLSEEHNLRAFSLDVLGGCLCLQNGRAIWIMKDYGENVWIKLVSFEQLHNISRPIAYIKEKGQVVFQLKKTNELLFFDLENKCAKKVRMTGVYKKGFTCQVFTPSLFRLKTLKRERKTAGDDRLDVELEVRNVEDPTSRHSFEPASYN